MDKPDIEFTLGSKEEQFWTDIKKRSEDMIDQAKHEIIIQEQILALAESKIAVEKETFK